MKRGRGRPPVYTDTTQHPALVALRIPRALETRLRQEATEQQRASIMASATPFWRCATPKHLAAKSQMNSKP
jgi:hypothetical protein